MSKEKIIPAIVEIGKQKTESFINESISDLPEIADTFKGINIVSDKISGTFGALNLSKENGASSLSAVKTIVTQSEEITSRNNFIVETPNGSELAKMTKALMAGDSHIIYAVLTIGGEEILSESNFDVKITQKIGNHDEFEIVCPTEALEGRSAYPMDKSRQFLGKSVTIELKQYGSSALIYTGIISTMKHRKFDGADGQIVICGHSPTILLENGLDCQSYENKSLKEIIESALLEYPQDAISLSISPNLKDKLPYTVQYKESDFDFISRLATRFGEWFYYNGQQLVFGANDGRLIELFEEQDLYDFELKMQIVPQKFSYTGYSGHRNEQFTIKSERETAPETINPFQKFAISASENIYGKTPQTYLNQQFDRGNTDLEELVRRQKTKRQNTVFLEGKSKNPNLRIGDRAKITAYMPGNKIFQNGEVPIETYKVVEIHHHHDGLDGYYNTFVGIPYRNIPVHTNEQAVPSSEEQSAMVVDNNDPKAMGRIRVQFPWQHQKNEKTPWIRILTPYAGNGKGFHVIPEIGEEVIVGFEGNDAEKPFILGAVFHGNNKSGHGGAGNYMKGFQTASGNKIQLNDKDGSILVQNGNGAGSISIDSAGNITIDTSENIYLKAGKNIEFDAKMNIKLTAQEDINALAVKNITADATINVDIHAKNRAQLMADILADVYSPNVASVRGDTATNMQTSGGNTTITGTQVDIN